MLVIRLMFLIIALVSDVIKVFIVDLNTFMYMCVQDPSLLEGRVTLHQVKASSVVARQGDQV